MAGDSDPGLTWCEVDHSQTQKHEGFQAPTYITLIHDRKHPLTIPWSYVHLLTE